MKYNYLADMHSHTRHSFDGHYSVEELCKASVEKCLKTVAFTDHVEMDFFHEKSFDVTADESFEDLKKAKSELKDNIEICVGVELGQPTYNVVESDKLIKDKDYDFVIGSIHNLRSKPDFAEMSYTGPEISGLLKEYFNEMKALANWAKFDTMAHLTYPLRYIVGNYGFNVDMTEYSSDIDEIFSILIEKDKALEINTSGLRQKIGLTLPDASYLKRYKQLGGKYITIGSDSHYTEHMGAGIEQGYDLARECGFCSTLIFRHRQPVEIPLE